MATEDSHVASSDSEPEEEEFRDRSESQPDNVLVIGEFSSFKQAGDFVDSHSSYRFKVHHKSARVGAMITTYRCASHLSCTYFLRLHSQDNKHTLEATGAHAEETSDVAKIGINRAILGEVDSLLRGNGPKACLVLLDKVCANDPEKLRFLPTEKQLKNRKQYLSKLAAGKSVRTYADLLKWAGGRLCETQVSFFGKSVGLFSLEDDRVEFADVPSSTQNDVIVLGCFSDASDPACMGLVCTSRKIFRNVAFSISDQGEDGVLGVTDGTYKVHFGGWTLVCFGSAVVAFDRQKYVHRYVPWAYMFVKSENERAYTEMFSIVRQRSLEFFGLELRLRFGSLDHAPAIANAFKAVWPGITLLNCWAHLARKASEKQSILKSPSFVSDVARVCLDYLHEARSPAQFSAMRDIVIAHWRACGEEAYATWLEAEYLSTNWYRWYRVSSGVAGVLPNQNPIESHHRSIKKSAIQSLRASTARVLNDVLPSVMIHAGNGADAVSSFGHYCGGLLSNEWVVAASQLTLYGNFRYVYQGRGPARLIQAILYNSSKYVSHGPHDGNLNSMKICTKRARVFENSLNGTLKRDATTDTLHVDYLSMHRVQIRDRTINIDHDIVQPVWTHQEALLVRSKYLCTCRSYFVTGWVCSHVVATMTLIDDFPLSVMMQALPARKPPGRPRKVPRALARDGNPTAFFDVDNLIALLLAKPSRLLNFPVLIENPSSHENIPGVVSTWKNQRGVYKWKVLLSDGSIEYLECQALAEAIRFANETGMTPG